MPAWARRELADLVRQTERSRQLRAIVARRNPAAYGAKVRAGIRAAIGALSLTPGSTIKHRARLVRNRIRNACLADGTRGPAVYGLRRVPAFKVIAEELKAADAELANKSWQSQPKGISTAVNVVNSLPAQEAKSEREGSAGSGANHSSARAAEVLGAGVQRALHRTTPEREGPAPT